MEHQDRLVWDRLIWVDGLLFVVLVIFCHWQVIRPVVEFHPFDISVRSLSSCRCFILLPHCTHVDLTCLRLSSLQPPPMSSAKAHSSIVQVGIPSSHAHHRARSRGLVAPSQGLPLSRTSPSFVYPHYAPSNLFYPIIFPKASSLLPQFSQAKPYRFVKFMHVFDVHAPHLLAKSPDRRSTPAKPCF
jgi:hypothetical protein